MTGTEAAVHKCSYCMTSGGVAGCPYHGPLARSAGHAHIVTGEVTGWCPEADRLARENEALKGALAEVKAHAERHHADEDPEVWLHSLTVHIPSVVEGVL